ncbi:hypothetical protein CHUAL_006530 [Chamberlinius hualienensis]
MRFHQRHGSCVVLEEDCTQAHRIDGFCDGVVFSELPISLNTYYTITTSNWDFWRGAFSLGFTTTDPSNISDVPKFISPYVTTQQPIWATFISEDYLTRHKRLTFYVNSCGELRLLVCDSDEETALANLPVIDHLWLIIDIYGGTTSVKLIQEHDAPLEVYAKGPVAVDNFNIANSIGGSIATYRTKFVLIGKNDMRKDFLKRDLIKRQKREEATSVSRHICGLEVSGWHLMADSDHRASKSCFNSTQSSDNIQISHPVSCIPSNFESRFYKTLAANLARGVLVQNKKQRKVSQIDCLSLWPNWTNAIKNDHLNISSDNLLNVTTDENVCKYLSVLPPDGNLKVRQLLQNDENKQNLDKDENEKSDHSNQQVVNIEFSIWDLDLNCLHHDLLQFIFTSRAIYLFDFDIDELMKPESNDEDVFKIDDLIYWLNCIHYYATPTVVPIVPNKDNHLSPPVILIATYHKEDDDQTNQKLEEKILKVINCLIDKPFYRHIVMPIVAIEIDDSANVEQMLHKCHVKIQEVLRQQPYYGEEIPKSWLNFEKTILCLQERLVCHADLSQILEIANSEGINTTDAQKAMLAFYNDIGVIMHFNGTIGSYSFGTMTDTIIVNPLWLIDSFNVMLSFGRNIISKPLKPLAKAIETLNINGILEEILIDFIWRDRSEHKATLLEMMSRLDLLCQKVYYSSSGCATITQQYYLPSKVNKKLDNDSSVEDQTTNVIFYLDFIDFLPDGLFRRLLIRTIRWSLEGGGWSPLLFRRGAHLHLKDSVDLIIEMQSWRPTLIKIVVLTNGDNCKLNDATDLGSYANHHRRMSSATSRACAMVRNFLESTLAGLRELWMKRLTYRTCVFCPCGRVCNKHQQKRCLDNNCRHFLLLDDCISNNVVLCEFNRVNTSFIRKYFPKPSSQGSNQPILPEAFVMKTVNSETIILDGVGMVLYQRPTPFGSTANHMVLDPRIATCLRSMSKILNGCGEGRDWVALALNLGYRQSKIDEFGEDLNPGLALIVDWLFSSGNTYLSTEMLISCLKRMENHELAGMLTEMQDDSNEATVFISYQWEAQDHVVLIRNRLEQSGLRCWMDIGQMGGGDLLYNRIYRGISRAKVVVVCITPKYVVSHNCAREASLADLLGKPIIPVMISPTPWPPPGPLAILFSQLLYIDLYGIGGHGGTGYHADWEDRIQEILNQIYNYVAPVYLGHGRKSNQGSRAAATHHQKHLANSPQQEISTDQLPQLSNDAQNDQIDSPLEEIADLNANEVAEELPPVEEVVPIDQQDYLFQLAQQQELNNLVPNEVRPDSTISTVNQNHVSKCSVCLLF